MTNYIGTIYLGISTYLTTFLWDLNNFIHIWCALIVYQNFSDLLLKNKKMIYFYFSQIIFSA